MWACTSHILPPPPPEPFPDAVGFTYSLVSRGNARLSPCLAKAGGKGGFAEPGEDCPAWHTAPTQRGRATPALVSRQHAGGLYWERSFTLNTGSSTKEAHSRLI